MNDAWIESCGLFGFIAAVPVGLAAAVVFLLLPKVRAIIIGELGLPGWILYGVCFVLLMPGLALCAGVVGSGIGCYWATSH